MNLLSQKITFGFYQKKIIEISEIYQFEIPLFQFPENFSSLISK